MDYYGDHAGILPDNTQAFEHFTDQFAQLEQQRRTEERRQRLEEQQRQNRLNLAISNDIFDKDRLKNDLTNPTMLATMNEMAKQYPGMMDKYGEQFVNERMHSDAAKLDLFAQKIKETNDNNAAFWAEQKALHPGIDFARGTNQAATLAFMNKDRDGNFTPKSLEEIDPKRAYGQEILDGANGKYLFPDEAIHNDWDRQLSKETIIDDKAEPEFNYDGTVKKVGYAGKTSRLVDVNRTATGFSVDPKSQLYVMPGESTPYIDPQSKQPIKVLPPNLFAEYYHGGIKAGIDKQVEAELEKATNFEKGNKTHLGAAIGSLPGKDDNSDDQGESNYGPNSEYANMLRQKFMYQKMEENIKDKYHVNVVTGDKESFGRQKSIQQEKDAQTRLALAREGMDIRHATLQFMREKEAKKEAFNPEDLPNFVDTLNTKYGQWVEVEVSPAISAKSKWGFGLFGSDRQAQPAKYEMIRFIPGNADNHDMTLAAGKRDAYQQRGTPEAEFYTKDGKKIVGYRLDMENGNLIGGNGAEIERNTAQRTYINSLKKQTWKEAGVVPPEPKPTSAKPPIQPGATAPTPAAKAAGAKPKTMAERMKELTP